MYTNDLQVPKSKRYTTNCLTLDLEHEQIYMNTKLLTIRKLHECESLFIK